MRRATEADVDLLGGTLARAFLDDPVSEWACPPEAARPRMLERFHSARLRQLIPHGDVWMTPGGESAALWAPPGRWKTTAREDLEISRSMLDPRLILRTPLVVRGLLGVERRHPAEPPHWYLATLGTDPAAQGRGFGSAVLAPVLELCDRDGVCAYLESSKERNIDYYARFGFQVTAELRLPRRGPAVWSMWREPR